jgi:F-type H+-transporting ATPase subunit epsilon
MADANETLELKVLTPVRELLDERVEQVTAEGALGQFGVLPKHTAFLTLLEPGLLTYWAPGGAERSLAVKGGYAEVKDDVVTVLAEDAIDPAQISAVEAKAALQAAEHAAAERPFGHPEHEQARREVRWAEVRVELARS